jgi:hypothetical protein
MVWWDAQRQGQGNPPRHTKAHEVEEPEKEPFVSLRGSFAWHLLGAGDAIPSWLAGLAVWGITAWLVFVIAWPAAWQKPLDMPYAVVHNAFLSATDTIEAEAEGYWLVPDLGILYYPVNGAFKLSPLATVGLLAWVGWVVRIRPNLPPSPQVERGTGGEVIRSRAHRWKDERGYVQWVLFAFAVLFVAFMTLGGKRSNRYLLPAWPALYLLAALGLARVAAVWPAVQRRGVVRTAAGILLALLLIAPIVAAYPYYLSYYNPLLGGPLSAPQVVKIGWGEGLDQVGRWLETRPDAHALRVGSPYASALSPFYTGRISDVTEGQLDYVVLYRKQLQEGDPSPVFLRYFQAETPLYTVRLAGIDYAWVYAGPTMQPAMANQAAFDIGILPKPLYFRLSRPYMPIGEPAGVEVLWLTEDRLPSDPTRLTLQTADDVTAPPDQRSRRPWAEATARLARRPDGLVVSHYALAVPPDLPRGSYGLLVDGRPLGLVEACPFLLPPLTRSLDANFGGEVRLVGVRTSEPITRETTLELVWQAAPRAYADYTVFLHLLDAEGTRVAGVDVAPPVPMSDWARGEVVRMRYAPDGPQQLPLPPGLPPGRYQLVVGLYRPDTGARLSVLDAAGAPVGDRVTLPLAVTP